MKLLQVYGLLNFLKPSLFFSIPYGVSSTWSIVVLLSFLLTTYSWTPSGPSKRLVILIHCNSLPSSAALFCSVFSLTTFLSPWTPSRCRVISVPYSSLTPSVSPLHPVSSLLCKTSASTVFRDLASPDHESVVFSLVWNATWNWLGKVKEVEAEGQRNNLERYHTGRIMDESESDIIEEEESNQRPWLVAELWHHLCNP